MMSGGVMGSWGMGYGVFGFFVMLFVWVLIAARIVVAIRWIFHGAVMKSPLRQESPLEILKRRSARGDIDREEFVTRKRELL